MQHAVPLVVPAQLFVGLYNESNEETNPAQLKEIAKVILFFKPYKGGPAHHHTNTVWHNPKGSTWKHTIILWHGT